MSKTKTFPYCMTLRLSAPMESELENLAYDRRMSKAGFIRACIRQAIADAYRHGTQNTQFQGAL
jgi:predicted DNA-binding protein